MTKKSKLNNTSEEKLHKNCSHAIPCRDRHLSNTGMPIMGRCPFAEYMFLLNSPTNCEFFEDEAASKISN